MGPFQVSMAMHALYGGVMISEVQISEVSLYACAMHVFLL